MRINGSHGYGGQKAQSGYSAGWRSRIPVSPFSLSLIASKPGN